MIGNLDHGSSFHEVAGLQVLAGTHEAVELFLKSLEVADVFFAAGLKDFFEKTVDELEALPKTALHTLIL